jgi:hypothetical protein
MATTMVLEPHRLAGLVDREFSRLGLQSLGIQGHWRTIEQFLRNVDVIDNELVPAARIGEPSAPAASARANALWAPPRRSSGLAADSQIGQHLPHREEPSAVKFDRHVTS